MDISVELLKRRNRETWAAVYGELADRVYQHALYRLKGDRSAAEDVTQEVFLRAIESIDSYQGDPSDLLRWLRGIGRRVMSRNARNLRPLAARPLSIDNGPSGEATSGAFEIADPRPLVREEMVRREEGFLTGSALTALPARWENALRWKYCDGASVAEVARRLGVSSKAAESLLGRARQAFRRSYQRLAESDGRLFDVEEWTDE